MSSEVPLQGPFVSAERIEVTTPIFYVNAAPHIGHLFSALLADAAARWHRFEGKQVLYMTGTDEHGQKIQRSAAAKGIPTQQFCDEVDHTSHVTRHVTHDTTSHAKQVSLTFRVLMEKANISFDDWIRTTQPRHKVNSFITVSQPV
jgi:methionyl-tRNA synthetase